LREVLINRLAECRLTLHPEKTRIAYCKDDKRRKEYPNRSFDFLGYTFRSRKANAGKSAHTFMSFLPGVSKAACLKMRQTVRSWKLRNRIWDDIFSLAKKLNPIIRGWLNYYGEYYKTALNSFWCYLDEKLVEWVRAKYKRFRSRIKDAWRFYTNSNRTSRGLFTHWKLRKAMG
jgi:RNA-directed DNA polymerase